jgi:hypothetical protein
MATATLSWAKRMAGAAKAIRDHNTTALVQALTAPQDAADGDRPLDYNALLLVAVNYENPDAVAAVLGAGANPAAVAEGVSMMDRAAAAPDKRVAAAMVQLLVQAGAEAAPGRS